jgi:hypothetical protein
LVCGSALIEDLVRALIEAGHLDEALKELMDAIRRGQRERPDRPNLRWWDLAAGLSVRLRQENLLRN